MKKEDVINKIENLKGYKGKFKKFAVLTISGAIGLSVLGTGAAYAYVKSNENYSQAQLEKVALKQIPGEVVGVKKDLDDDNMSVVYEFKIKDKNNIIKEVEVDSVSGKVVDIENYDSNSDKNNETIDHENVKQGTSNMD